MNYQVLPPSPELQWLVLHYYNVSGLSSEVEPYLEKTLPNGLLSFVFHFGKRIVVSNVDYDGADLPQYYVFGLYTRPVYVRHTFGESDAFGVVFRPGAFRHLIAESQNVFTDQVFDVCDVFGKEFRTVLNYLEDQSVFPVWPENDKSVINMRKEALENYLVNRLRYKDITGDIVDRTLREIYQNDDRLTLEGLGKKFRATPQYLNRVFNESIGISVKKYIRIVRFNRMYRLWMQNMDLNIERLADEFGYANHAHLIRDFHQFAGNKPSVLKKESQELAFFLSNGQ